MTASQSQSQSHCSDVDHLTLLMLNSRLVEDGELWFPQIKLLIMCPVVQLQSIICVHESSSCFAWSLTLSIIAIQSRSMVRFLDTFRRLPHTASFSLLQHYFGLNSSTLRGNFQHDDKRPLIIIAMFAIFFYLHHYFWKSTTSMHYEILTRLRPFGDWPKACLYITEIQYLDNLSDCADFCKLNCFIVNGMNVLFFNDIFVAIDAAIWTVNFT